METYIPPVRSKSEVRRLFLQGAVKVNGNKVGLDYVAKCGDKVQVGKKEFFKVVINGCDHKNCPQGAGNKNSV